VIHGVLVFAALAAFALSAQAQWLHYPTPGIPRKANGDPDLEAPVASTTDSKPNLSGICG
jgi:hypothetical protein